MIYKRTCAICEKAFKTDKRNKICCDWDCAQERKRIIARWNGKKRRLDQKREIFKAYENG